MIQRILASLAIAFLLMAHPCVDLVEAQSSVRYHSTIALAPLVGALMLDLLILTALFFFAMFVARKLGIWPWVRLALAAWLPLLLVRRIGLMLGPQLNPRLAQLLFVLGVVGLYLLWRRQKPVFFFLMKSGSAALACLGISALLLATRMIPIARWHPAQPIATQAASMPAHAGPHLRIVWIVFDELSYDQTFGHRLAGLQLPAFDALSGESVKYSRVQPVGDRTEQVLPSLLLGRTIQDVKYTWSNQLMVQLPLSLRWIPFRAARTPFALAKERGWNTGVVGWYNPYCSLLKPYLDDCYWSHYDVENPAWTLVPGQSAFSGAMDGLGVVFGSRADKEKIETEAARSRLHLISEQKIYAHALTLAANDRIDLMLLHLPVPHFPNVYDRHTGKFTLRGNSYADNLVLADIDLAGLLKELQASPRWADTMVIVCGDHSWRAPWWRITPYWTAEDERISDGGKFDPRPAMLVHYPGQTAGFVDSEAVSLMEVHRIIASMITTGHAPVRLPELQQAQSQAMPAH
jgi:hypothetical protein